MARTLWIQGDSGKNSGSFLIDADRRLTPILVDGSNHTLNFGFFNFDSPVSLASYSSITVAIVESQTVPTVFASKTTLAASFNSSLTLTNWNGRLAYHLQVAFTGVELDYNLGTQAEKNLWLVVTGVDGSGGEHFLASGAVRLVADSSYTGTGPAYMLKSVYDSDDSGIVDEAESVDWDNVQDKVTVSEGVAGLAPAGPATDPTLKYLRGDSTWTQVAYSGLSGIPSTFAPSVHVHADVSTGTAGFAPAGPATDPTLKYLRGDATWTQIPYADLSGIPSTFTPASHVHADVSTGVAGFAPAGPATDPTLKYLRGDSTWTQVAYSSLTGTPSTFTPAAHASTHHREGSDPLDGDKIPLDVGLAYITPDTTPAQTNHVSELAAIIKGIDNQFGTILQGVVYKKTVINYVDNTAAPPTEVTGDRYILDDTGASHAGWDGASALSIVEFDGTSWVEYAPSEGWRCYVDAENEDRRYIDDGSPAWQAISASGGETNTMSNVGASGVSVFKQKTGVDFELHKILGGAGITASLGSDIITLSMDNLNAKGNFAATAAPTATDDSGSGYSVGSPWVNVTTDRAYICLDASSSAAIWALISGGADGWFGGLNYYELDATNPPDLGDNGLLYDDTTDQLASWYFPWPRAVDGNPAINILYKTSATCTAGQTVNFKAHMRILGGSYPGTTANIHTSSISGVSALHSQSASSVPITGAGSIAFGTLTQIEIYRDVSVDSHVGDVDFRGFHLTWTH